MGCEPEILEPEGHPISASKPDPSAAFRKDITGLACLAKSSGRIDLMGGPNPGRGGVAGMIAARG